MKIKNETAGEKARKEKARFDRENEKFENVREKFYRKLKRNKCQKKLHII